MDPPVKLPRVAPAAVAGSPPPPPPPPPLNLRCSPADAGAPCCFAALSDEVLFRVFAVLPADARAACARVCAPWREALVRDADAWRFWTRLDLSGGSGVVCTKSDAALAGAAALARGRLQELDLGNHSAWPNRDGITLGAVLRVLRGSPELQVLALDGVDGHHYLDTGKLDQLAAAAWPTLHRLDAGRVICISSAESLPLLHAGPPFGSIRMWRLTINCLHDPPGEGIGAVKTARSFGAAVSHAWLRELYLERITWTEPAALEALTDALLARTCRVAELTLCGGSSGLSPAYLPALARLLAGSDGAALTSMSVLEHASLFEGASAADVELVCAALRRSTLINVYLLDVGLTEQTEAALQQAEATAPRLRLML